MRIKLLNGKTIQDALQHLELRYNGTISKLYLETENIYIFKQDSIQVMVMQLEGNELVFVSRGDYGDLVGALVYWAN